MARRLARLVPLGRQCQPHRPQHRDELPLHVQARVRLVVRARERPLVSALEEVVVLAPQGGVEGFARHVLEPPAPGRVQPRAAQRLSTMKKQRRGVMETIRSLFAGKALMPAMRC